MHKRQKYYKMLFLLLNIILIMEAYKRKPREIRVNDRIAGYTYFDRRLSVSDFEQFDYNTAYEDLVDCIGLENGTIGSGIVRPYYELNDGRFVIWSAAYKKSISVVNSKNHEYYILPPQLSTKSDIIRNRQMKTACQSELNSILWMLDLKTLAIKDYWENDSENDQKNTALGEYDTDLLKNYTNRNITAEISYYFGNYRESGYLPLIQVIQLYEQQKLICFGYVLWDTDTYWDMFFKGNNEYAKDGEDCIVHAERYKLKGQNEVLNIHSTDKAFNIKLSSDKLANSLIDFLIKQKVIKSKRNSCVEFWGNDGNGKYVCLLSANPRKIGWGISAESRNTQYYFVQMETLDDAVVSVNVVHLLRRLQ